MAVAGPVEFGGVIAIDGLEGRSPTEVTSLVRAAVDLRLRWLRCGELPAAVGLEPAPGATVEWFPFHDAEGGAYCVAWRVACAPIAVVRLEGPRASA
jgi:hypothetical protein